MLCRLRTSMVRRGEETSLGWGYVTVGGASAGATVGRVGRDGTDPRLPLMFGMFVNTKLRAQLPPTRKSRATSFNLKAPPLQPGPLLFPHARVQELVATRCVNTLRAGFFLSLPRRPLRPVDSTRFPKRRGPRKHHNLRAKKSFNLVGVTPICSNLRDIFGSSESSNII